LKFTIRFIQLILAIWTAIAVFLALLIVTTVWASLVTMPPFNLIGTSVSGFCIPWQAFVLMYFVFLLILVLPVYLLLFLVDRLSRSSEDEDN
jgi:hypothetical protein